MKRKKLILDSLTRNKKKINAKLGRDMRLASSSPTGFDNKIFPLKSFRLCRFLFPQ